MKVAATIAAVLALAACGTTRDRSAEGVARAWSAALDRNDNAAAADLFAEGAKVVQRTELVLRDHADAERWNASLPCGGEIVSIEERDDGQVLVVFRLTERPEHTCDAPGERGAALFRVRDGKIVLWHQTAVPPAGAGGTRA